MLQELTIRNFALLEQVHLAFEPGLNVLTGETGAGKSIIIDAISTVLGGRASIDAIRTGADRALVEAIFALPAGDEHGIRRLLRELGLLEDDGAADRTDGTPSTGADGAVVTAGVTGTNNESGADGANGSGGALSDVQPGGPQVAVAEALILTRELMRSGRSVARVNGRAVPVSVVAQIGAQLVDIHGQHESLSLVRPEAQRDLLDRFGGLMDQRAALAVQVRELRALWAELRAMQQDEREVARRIDLLSFQIEEIQGARLQPGEDHLLAQERTRLSNAARLAELATAVYGALAGGTDDQRSALDLLGIAARDLERLVRIDSQLADEVSILAEAQAQVEELGHTLRAYQGAIEFAPERLEAITERLDFIKALQRKYGESIADIQAFGERAAEELERLVNREAHSAELAQRQAGLEAEIAASALALSRARRAAGQTLASAVAGELRDLSLRGVFEVFMATEPDAGGIPWDGGRVRFDESGADMVEFRFAPNAGEPAKSVARTASGGELSRVLLALKAVLSAADRTPTLIFDEVDAGVGGRNGQTLGEKLSYLGDSHQVLCVTHLPQIAAFGDVHYFIAKHERDGRTITTVDPLGDELAVAELAQMLGGATPATLGPARELKVSANEWKQRRRAGGAQLPLPEDGAAATARPTSAARPARQKRRQAVSDHQHADLGKGLQHDEQRGQHHAFGDVFHGVNHE